MSAPILLILRIALAAAIYAFLGWAFYTLWQDFKRQGQTIANLRRAPSLTLVQQEEDSASSFRFTHPDVTIGRDPASDLVLEDPTISAQHARLSYHHGHWWIEDMRSTNGTFLNQEPVEEPMVITAGDELRCGQLRLLVDPTRTDAADRERNAPGKG